MFYVHLVRCVLVAFLIATTPWRYEFLSKTADVVCLCVWCTLLIFYAVRWGQFLAGEKNSDKDLG